MEVQEFFDKARKICDSIVENQDCYECPLYIYCVDGIFSNDPQSIANLIEAVRLAEVGDRDSDV